MLPSCQRRGGIAEAMTGWWESDRVNERSENFSSKLHLGELTMNNDYLWDKTGSDAEIEELENALRNFAHREVIAPAIAKTEVIVFKPKPRVKIFRYAMAVAACLLFVAVSLGIWINVSRNASIDETMAQDTNADKFAVTQNELQKDTTQAGSEIRIYGVEQIPAAKQLKKKIVPIARKVRKHAAASEPALTAEEQYAYEQLKLALSITGSKLRLIKEKVESHEPVAVIEDGR